MFLLQLANKVDTDVDPVRFEIDEIKPAAIIGGIEFAREINQLSKGSADLKFQHNQLNLSLPFVKVSLFVPVFDSSAECGVRSHVRGTIKTTDEKVQWKRPDS